MTDAAVQDDGTDRQRMLGGFIRAQRTMANLSLRQLSALAQVSNPYLSQVERGLHAPSVRVLTSIADALDVSAEVLLEHAGVLTPAPRAADVGADGGTDRGTNGGTEAAIRSDARLTLEQRTALLGVYRSYVGTSSQTAP